MNAFHVFANSFSQPLPIQPGQPNWVPHSADTRLASTNASDMSLANICAYGLAAEGEHQVPKFCGTIDARDMRQDRRNHGQQAESRAIASLKVAMFISPEGQLDDLSCFIYQGEFGCLEVMSYCNEYN